MTTKKVATTTTASTPNSTQVNEKLVEQAKNLKVTKVAEPTPATPVQTSEPVSAPKSKKSKKSAAAPATPAAPDTPTVGEVKDAVNAAKETSAPADGPVTETPAGAAAPAKAVPFGGKQAPAFETRGKRDGFGFGEDTETSWLLHRLLEAKYTKETLLAAFVAKFTKGNTDEVKASDAKRKKTSFSVFFSDVVKPFGTYHASRSIVVLEDKESKVLSLEPKSVSRAKKAIAANILTELRGLTPRKHRVKINTVLGKHGLPLLADSTKK